MIKCEIEHGVGELVVFGDGYEALADAIVILHSVYKELVRATPEAAFQFKKFVQETITDKEDLIFQLDSGAESGE